MHLCLQPCSLDNTLNTDHPQYMEKVLTLEKTKPVCFRGHFHTESESSHSLRQIDTSGRVGLERTVTHKYQFDTQISVFVEMGYSILY